MLQTLRDDVFRDRKNAEVTTVTGTKGTPMNCDKTEATKGKGGARRGTKASGDDKEGTHSEFAALVPSTLIYNPLIDAFRL